MPFGNKSSKNFLLSYQKLPKSDELSFLRNFMSMVMNTFLRNWKKGALKYLNFRNGLTLNQLYREYFILPRRNLKQRQRLAMTSFQKLNLNTFWDISGSTTNTGLPLAELTQTLMNGWAKKSLQRQCQ